jgi:DNA-binding CsgD family transcriptional regulator
VTLASPVLFRAVEQVREALANGSGAAHGFRSAELTARERDVLERLAEGRATEEIAELLHVSPHTVRSRVKTLLRKLDARNREHAVAIALSEGAIHPDL